jgi:hypothetical protein
MLFDCPTIEADHHDHGREGQRRYSGQDKTGHLLPLPENLTLRKGYLYPAGHSEVLL